MRLILHIGMQKTGTSALQFFLHDNRNRLLQDGFRYPTLEEFSKVKFSGVSYHNCVAAKLINVSSAFQPVSDDEMSALRSMIENSDHPVLLSAEDFSRSLDVKNIRKFTSGLKVSIIIYLRDQADWIQSMYNQRNKILFNIASDRIFKDDMLSPQDVFEFLRQEKYAPLLKYDQIIDLWSSISSDIRVRLFSKGHLVGGDLIKDFMNALDVKDLSGYRMPPRVNDNLANEWISIARETAATEGIEAAKALMRRLTKTSVDGNIDLSGTTKILSEQIIQKVRSDYREHNQRVAQKYFGRSDLF